MQQYVTTETTYLLDSVRNLGFLSKNMYEQYVKKIELGNNLYEVELTHYHLVLYVTNEEGLVDGAEPLVDTEFLEGIELSQKTKGYNCYYTADIMEAIYNEKDNYRYDFNQNDYVTIKVRRRVSSLAKRMQHRFLGSDFTDQGYVTIYGGMIRDEAY